MAPKVKAGFFGCCHTRSRQPCRAARRSAEAAGLVDVDLGFTPATNLLPIRRLDHGSAKTTPAPAAYLAFPQLELVRLDQTYRRLDESRYAYAASAFGYEAVLTVSSAGFVLDYPGLWRSAA